MIDKLSRQPLDKIREKYKKLQEIDFEDIIPEWKKIKGYKKMSEYRRVELRCGVDKFQRYFAIAGLVDFSAVPTRDADVVWRACLENKDFYEYFSMKVFGRVLEYRLSDNTEVAQDNQQKTAEVYWQVFEEVYELDDQYIEKWQTL